MSLLKRIENRQNTGQAAAPARPGTPSAPAAPPPAADDSNKLAELRMRRVAAYVGDNLGALAG
ncbi:MAG TPA: hypothetical protein PLC98_23900, partial [Anaerolineales bacterium]|nr:hypothetical protein [Anaerolineales bacterium]